MTAVTGSDQLLEFARTGGFHPQLARDVDGTKTGLSEIAVVLAGSTAAGFATALLLVGGVNFESALLSGAAAVVAALISHQLGRASSRSLGYPWRGRSLAHVYEIALVHSLCAEPGDDRGRADQ